MAKFGRFKFGEEEPTEIYFGDCMELDKGYVKIRKGKPPLVDPGMAQIVAVVHLDKGQSVRELAEICELG